MTETAVIISIKPYYAQKIFEGKKLFELRRRKVSIVPGTTLLIYSTLPDGQFLGSAVVKAVYSGSPAQLKRFRERAAISVEDYESYFQNAFCCSAIELTGIQPFRRRLSLNDARKIDRNFHPPQFFIKVSAGNRIFQALKKAA